MQRSKRYLHLLEGDLPARALAMAREWGKLHAADLLHIWETQEFVALPPLK